MARTPRERTRQRCVMTTDSEWEMIRALAGRDGMSNSRFLVERALESRAHAPEAGSPCGFPPHPEAGYPTALTGTEQRRQFEIVDRCVAVCGPLTQAPFIEGAGTTIGQALNFLTLSLDPDWSRFEDLPLGG